MTGSTSSRFAAVVQFLLSIGLAIMVYPDLSKGATAEGGGPTGFVVTAAAFATAIAGIVSAYGVWANMKWGKVLALVVNTVFVLLFLGAVAFASPGVKLVAAIMIAVNGLIIVLLLRRTAAPVAA